MIDVVKGHLLWLLAAMAGLGEREEGQDMVEYALLAALISIVAIAIILLIGPCVDSTTDLNTFRSAVQSAVQRDILSCIVAKVDAVGPKTFHMDVTLLENRFEFSRYFKNLDAPSHDLG